MSPVRPQIVLFLWSWVNVLVTARGEIAVRAHLSIQLLDFDSSQKGDDSTSEMDFYYLQALLAWKSMQSCKMPLQKRGH